MTSKLNLAKLYREQDPARACKLALARTKGAPPAQRLELINKLLGFSGVQAIRGRTGVICTYAATGFTYALTVLCVPSSKGPRFIVGNPGDWIDANYKRLGFADRPDDLERIQLCQKPLNQEGQ